MDINTILIAVASVTVIGVVCAAVLCIASKFMNVKVDERVEQLQKSLPGVNCGVCGFPGCSGYAAALLSGTGVRHNLCTPGGSQVLAKISAILGVKAGAADSFGTVEKKTAVVHCAGDCGARQKKMDYMGIPSCSAAKQLFGGEGACAFGCLGYGDCKAVCPSNAICVSNGLTWINVNLCTGCGICVKACPNTIISIESAAIPVIVSCSNWEKGAVVRKKCSRGCISCGKCVRECPEKAITLEDNLAVIDYAKCSGCKHCVEACIAKCILAVFTASPS